MRRDPLLDMTLLRKLCHELRLSARHAISAVQNDAQASVVRFVLWLWRSKLPVLASENGVTSPMPRHDIAGYLGLHAESVPRALLQLERAQLIQGQGPAALVLLNIPRLRRVPREIWRCTGYKLFAQTG